MSDLLPIRVIKIGGSLLQRKDLAVVVKNWAADHAPGRNTVNLWLTGGGALVDVIRRLDNAWVIPAELTHQIAIQLMGANATLLTSQFPAWPLVESLQQIHPTLPSTALFKPIARSATRQASNLILKPVELIRELEYCRPTSPPNLPSSWDVTSDSIAAWLGIKLDAVEIHLLKSCSIVGDDIHSWSEAGIVDPYFKNLEHCLLKIPVSCHCLGHKTL